MTGTAATASVTICVHCGAPNRVAAGKALSAGKCGKCSRPLATAEPVDISGDMLERLIARDTGAFVLDVWAPWCGPCRMMAPSYAAAAAKFADDVRFFKLNSDQNQPAAGKLGIRGIPTLFAWAGGQRIAAQPGAQTGEALNRWIQSTFRLSA